MSEHLDLDAIEAMCAAATPGQWVWSHWRNLVAKHSGCRTTDNIVIIRGGIVDVDANEEFIAQSRTLIPALVARVRADGEMIAEFAGALRALRDGVEGLPPLTAIAGALAVEFKDATDALARFDAAWGE